MNSSTNDCECDSGYFEPLVQDKVCSLCSLTVSFCSLCSSSSGSVICSECQPGYSLFTSNNTCIPCGDFNCDDCSQTSNECFDCATYFTINSTVDPCSLCDSPCS